MFPTCMASFLAVVAVTAGGEFISSWLWPSQPPVRTKQEAGALDSWNRDMFQGR